MRKHNQHTIYHSILPALQKPGCPFCRVFKEFQMENLQSQVEENLRQLRNLHVWGLAAVQGAPDAARMFMRLLNQMTVPCGSGISGDICRQIVEEEDLRNDWDQEHNRTGWGAVGHAAEFLVAHRGLRA